MKRKPPLQALPKYEPCGSCIGGWVLTWTNTKGFAALPKASRCWCWTKHQDGLAEALKPRTQPSGDAA